MGIRDDRYGWAARFYDLVHEGLVVRVTYSSQTDFAASYSTRYEAQLGKLADEGEQGKYGDVHTNTI